MYIRFRADELQASNLRMRIYSQDRATLLATIVSLAGPTPPNPFVEQVPGSYRCDVGSPAGSPWFVSINFVDTGEVAVDGFCDASDGELREAPISAATTIDITFIANEVYSKLAGGRSTLLSGPTSTGGPLDQVKTVDLDYTIPITVPADSELQWFMRCHPDAPSAYLIASKSVGLTTLMTTTPTPGDAVITRNADNVRVQIKAAALSQLPNESLACELREITAGGTAKKSRHEVTIDLRHSAGR